MNDITLTEALATLRAADPSKHYIVTQTATAWADGKRDTAARIAIYGPGVGLLNEHTAPTLRQATDNALRGLGK